MKAMLIWSDGHSLHYTIFEDKDGKTGFERAQEQDPAKQQVSVIMKRKVRIAASGRL